MNSQNYKVAFASVEELLNNKRGYKIPIYQRAYTWTQDRAEGLWDTVIDRYADGNDTEEHLIGPIVTVVNRDMADSVVDGQQRLVSLTLMYCAMRDVLKSRQKDQKCEGEFKTRLQMFLEKINKRVLNNNGNARIEPDYDDSDNALLRKICQGGIERGNKLRSGANVAMRRNYKEFQRRSDALYDKLDLKGQSIDGIRELERIVEAMEHNVFVVDVKVEDEMAAQRIFEALNSKGLILTQADLIKSYLIQKNPKLKQSWDTAFGPFEEELKNNYAKHDYLVYHSMLSRNYELENNKGIRKGKDIGKGDLHRAVLQGVLDERGAQDYIEYLKRDLSIIYRLEKPSEKNPTLNHLLYGLTQVNAVYFQRPIIAAVRRWGLEDIRTVQLIECLLKFFFMYRTVCKMDIDKLRTMARELTTKINDVEVDVTVRDLCNSVVSIASRKSDEKPLEAFKKQFAKDFVEQDYIADAAKYVLISIEQELQKDLKIHTAELEIEHIYPKKPNEDAWPNSAELEDLKDNIGNLTLLPKKWNRALQNYSFEVKKTGKKNNGEMVRIRGKEGKDIDGNPIDISYNNSSLELNTRISEYDNWDCSAVLDRQQSLLKYAEKIWDVSEYILQP